MPEAAKAVKSMEIEEVTAVKMAVAMAQHSLFVI